MNLKMVYFSKFVSQTMDVNISLLSHQNVQQLSLYTI